MSLEPEQEDRFSKAAIYLNGLKLDIDVLFTLFTEWQSSKQKSLKRIIISLCVVISLLFIVGGDLTAIGWIDDQVEDNKSNWFLFIIFLYLIITSMYLYRIRRIDLKVRDAKLNDIEKEINDGKIWVDVFDEISESSKLKLNAYLDKYAKVYKDSAQDSYLAIKFYEKHLKKTYDEFNLWQAIEVKLLSVLVIFSSIALLSTMFEITFDQILCAFHSF